MDYKNIFACTILSLSLSKDSISMENPNPSIKNNETIVELFCCNSISSTPVMNDPITISIDKLHGSTAMVLHVKYSNGEQYAELTSRLSLERDTNQINLNKICTQALNQQKEDKLIKKINFFITFPTKYVTEYKKNHSRLKHIIDKQMNDKIKTLENTIKTIFTKNKVKISVIPYITDSTFCSNSLEKQKDFSVILHPNFATASIISKHGTNVSLYPEQDSPNIYKNKHIKVQNNGPTSTSNGPISTSNRYIDAEPIVTVTTARFHEVVSNPDDAYFFINTALTKNKGLSLNFKKY